MTETLPAPFEAILRPIRWYIHSWTKNGIFFAIPVCIVILLNANFYLDNTGEDPFNFYLAIALFFAFSLCYSALEFLKIKYDAYEIAKVPTQDTKAIIAIGILGALEYAVFPYCFLYIIKTDILISLLRMMVWPPDLVTVLANLSLIASLLSPFIFNKGNKEYMTK